MHVALSWLSQSLHHQNSGIVEKVQLNRFNSVKHMWQFSGHEVLAEMNNKYYMKV